MKTNKMRKILSAFLAATVIAAPVSGAIPYVAKAESGEVSASVTFGTSIVTNKASVNISSTPQDINYALTGSYEGRGCVITQLQRNSSNNGNLGISHIPILVDDTYIDSDDRNIAVKLTYFDHDWDTIHVVYKTASGSRIQHDIVKYGTNKWRTATIVLRNPQLSNADITVRTGVTVAADIIINAAEDTLLRDTEYISKVEIVNLDKTYSEPLALSKTDILHIAEARALSENGLFEGLDEAEGEKYGLDKPITKEQAAKAVIKLAYEGTTELANATCTAPDVSDEAKSYIGLALEKGIITSEADGSIGADEYVTMQQMLDMFIHIITGAAPSDTYTAATNLKLVKKLSGADEYGITGTGIYNVMPGLWTVEINNLERYAYADDLAAISYNMLYQTVSGRSGMQRIIDACRKNNVKLGCIFQRRTFDAAIAVKQAVESGKFGRVTIGSANLRYYRDQEYYDSGEWRGTWELDGGGALMNQGVHGVDMLGWMMGGIESVYAKCDKLCWDIDVEDTAVVVVKFKDGAVGTIECCTTAYPGLDTVFHVSGSEGNVIIGDKGIYQWEFADGSAKPDTTGNMGGINCAYHTDNYGHIMQIEDMALAVLNNTEPMVSGEDAMQSVSVILAIYESARTGKEIFL